MTNVVNRITGVEDKVAALYGVLQTQEGLAEEGGGQVVDMDYLLHLEDMLEEVLDLQSLAKAWGKAPGI